MSRAMSVTVEPTRGDEAARSSRVSVVIVLLACGIGYAVLWPFMNDVVAASLNPGYNHMTQAISELSATAAPTRTMLRAMAPVFTVLMVAYGVGVWMAAHGRRSLEVAGAVLAAFGFTGLMWLPFPMTSRTEMVAGAAMTANDVGHIVLTVLTIVLILCQIGFGAAALGTRFRIYSAATAVMVLVFGAMTGMEAPGTALDDTPHMGLYERISTGAWLVWLAVFAIALIRRELRRQRQGFEPAPA
ncbi:MAG: DUF998 domain-containing protein [Acidimicrobiia bacterium]|nr:DUF998 domain-containing protein [Acidimicrobiia bacterium]